MGVPIAPFTPIVVGPPSKAVTLAAGRSQRRAVAMKATVEAGEGVGKKKQCPVAGHMKAWRLVEVFSFGGDY